ncbi:16S rRNA (guanine(527)-N(7))-methyltransferase RsmG [Cryomorphaceae bacterium]|nr:16S rRNA (guanine(527)-N(7))-methyltransferase RsmG [Cryomorphaceae bacterium]
MKVERIFHYFPDLTDKQRSHLAQLYPLYMDWNAQINVISRKDTEHFYERHVLHSLALAKVQGFLPGTKVLDVGTGGGFPGIPLAILFPETEFRLVDSIGKKIKVVQAVANELHLDNVTAVHQRAEKVKDKFDFVVSRAVTRMDAFVPWVRKKFLSESRHPHANGILYLKGGDLREELASFPKATLTPLKSFFSEEFFETKQVVHLPVGQ